jgi:hypothetical protein
VQMTSTRSAAQGTPLEQVERGCDLAFLHLVGAGMVTAHPEDLVVLTLRRVLDEARACSC